jgi:hypothetical protein
MIGTCLSFLIRVELSSPSAQILANDAQLYNTIITAHAFLMSVTINFLFWLQGTVAINIKYCLKSFTNGRIEPYVERQTLKRKEKVVIRIANTNRDFITYLSSILISLRNLKLNNSYQRNVLQILEGRSLHINTGIINGIKDIYVNVTTEMWIIFSKNLSRTNYQLKRNSWLPKGSQKIREPIGDGSPIVLKRHLRSGLVNKIFIYNYSTKAGSNTKRGSVTINPDSAIINIKAISNLKNLVLAYETIKSKPGNMTASVDKITLDGININEVKRFRELLKSGKFKFKPGKMIEIPKPGKTENRMLIIASPREKIIQQAMAQIFNAYYDSKFSKWSFGYRPNTGIKNAIKTIDCNFQSSRWIIEGDLTKCFDSISHNKLLNILKQDIKCNKTLKLIKFLLKAGYINNMG